MFDNAHFQKLVEADNLTGEVVAVNRFLVEVKGLEGVRVGAQVLFENGQRGLVREAYGDKVILYNIDTEELPHLVDDRLRRSREQRAPFRDEASRLAERQR